MKYIALTVALWISVFTGNAQTPDYNLPNSWAWVSEKANVCPDGMLKRDGFKDLSQNMPGRVPDVFYLYPTFYKEVPVKNWNADMSDEEVIKDVLELALPHQASVFCGVSRLFVPFYRQMHINGYRNTHLPEVLQAYDTAYADVLRAFETYLRKYHKGADIVIAAHSQGTNHAERLIKERILPDTSLRKKLVLAYLIGMPVKENFDDFPLCREAGQTQCFMSWRSYGKDFIPPIHGDSFAVINPITFSSDQSINVPEAHNGILLPNHKFRFPGSVVVQQKDGYLRVEELDIPFARRYEWEDYHRADYNLYWGNIRQNFIYRMNRYEEQAEGKVR